MVHPVPGAELWARGVTQGVQYSPIPGSRTGKEEGLRARQPGQPGGAGADHQGQVYADPSGAHTAPQV